ncbi:hypothetical protein [Tessaracoccus massiliensis]|uniref:hypothetical protein n=1 Tax=Tessaracoccus massiliensis TaxID=1522311 RepID=UPI00058CE29B|nr:hypothetical protein [Tessaracoccus massiliensis]
MGIAVVGLLLVTGSSRWRAGWVNLGQLAAAAWLLFVTGFATVLNVAFSEMYIDERPCVRPNCWPNGWQEVLQAAPMLLALLTMGAAACLAHRLGWVARAAIPMAVFLIARVVQVLLWRPVIFPWLNGS